MNLYIYMRWKKTIVLTALVLLVYLLLRPTLFLCVGIFAFFVMSFLLININKTESDGEEEDDEEHEEEK